MTQAGVVWDRRRLRPRQLLPEFLLWLVINERLVLCFADSLCEGYAAHAIGVILVNFEVRLRFGVLPGVALGVRLPAVEVVQDGVRRNVQVFLEKTVNEDVWRHHAL